MDNNHRRRIAGLVVAILALHAAGFALLAWYGRSYPALTALGLLAYTFGLRHAFDADHIAAIDNATRRLIARDGGKPLGVGFFFSLGHSSVVLALAVALGVATGSVQGRLPSLRHWGGLVGTGVSGVFLVAIGVLNLVVLVDVARTRDERRLLDRGLMSRGVLRRLGDRIHASWQMAPLGALFGLGFDTATEVGLLALSAGAAERRLPFTAVLSLPLLFAAGMSLLDTLDGALMSHAYDWARARPGRRAYYDLTVTALSVTVALGIGGVELVQLAARRTWLDVSHTGYLVVGLFALTWAASTVIWKTHRSAAAIR